MKSQTLIVQFIIFFTIGLVFFLTVGNLFRFQAELIRGDVIEVNSRLTNSYMSALIITTVNSCKSCNITTAKVDIKNIVGLYPSFYFDRGLVLSVDSENKIVRSPMHNLNYSVNMGANQVSSVRTITLTFDRDKNNLVMQ